MKAFSLGISETLHSILKQSRLTLRPLSVYMQAKGETKKPKRHVSGLSFFILNLYFQISICVSLWYYKIGKIPKNLCSTEKPAFN